MSNVARPRNVRRARTASAWPHVLPMRLVPLTLFVAAVAVLSIAGKQDTATAKAGLATFQPCRGASQQNCVIDGDTIRYAGAKIRLADLNAPEVSRAQCAAELELGERTMHRLVELMNAGPFTVAKAGGPDEDSYGRKLRVVMRDGRSVSNTLIAEGLARPWNGNRQSWCG